MLLVARPSSVRRFLASAVCSAFALGSLLAPASAAEGTSFRVRVHGHEFHRASIEPSKCRLRYKLYFSAPADRYSAARRDYRFRARLKFHGVQAIVTRVFLNSAPGQKVYAAEHDTSAEGCWAAESPKLLGVDVQACRGRECIPEAFER